VAITLTRLAAKGLGVPDAEVVFAPTRTLIRGPSDTGKSYIRDCLRYMLGGGKAPKNIPEAEGYTSLSLEFASAGTSYRVEAALKGGGTAVFSLSFGDEGHPREEKLEIDEGELLVRLSGASDKEILRSQEEKGAVTGGDLRHWFLLSQSRMISEAPIAEDGFATTQRVAAFNLFLTGSDDASVQVRKSSQEVERIKGQLTSAEEALMRAKAGLPSQLTRKDVEDAFDRVDETLTQMNHQYQARASLLKDLREQMVSFADSLNELDSARRHSKSMVERFRLLDQKYNSDLQRLNATSEGVAVFEVLPRTDCPLCGTPVEKQMDPKQLLPGAASKYRAAITAEAGKILSLKTGLKHSLDREVHRLSQLQNQAKDKASDLRKLEVAERQQLSSARVEFAADPKTMAHRHSELSAQLASFDEVQRRENEIERLKKAKVRKRFELSREGGAAAQAVAALAKEYLLAWGFSDVSSVELDAMDCDLQINGRERLSYGAGKKGLFLSAFALALLRHSTSKGFPHLGLVVLDSPLKAYADPAQEGAPDVPVNTVVNRFYAWLSTWEGPGQIIVLENEEIDQVTAVQLNPVQFSGRAGEGRQGFYPALQMRRSPPTEPLPGA
jgi:rubrerythrin